MKDSYSFDRDEAGLDESFEKNRAAYHRIFERCGLEVRAVEAESGMMGGSRSVDFLAPAASGENTLVQCARTATTRPTSTSPVPSRGRRSFPNGSTRRRSTRLA